MIDPMGGSLSAIYIGNTRASAVYVGSTKVWPDSAPTYTIFNVLPARCNRCGFCVNGCPVDAITTDNTGRLVSIDESICIQCEACVGQCVGVANANAITLK